jgi:1-phosphofructokinase family hexose kinase
MILTVTPNTTIDQTLVVPSLPMNRTTRAIQSVQSMGGKPTDASWILGEVGIPSLALGFASGTLGNKVQQMLEARGASVNFTWVRGETRLNTVIITQDGSGAATITTATLEVDPQHEQNLRHAYRHALDTATCVILGGTLPKGLSPTLYAEMIQWARERHIPTIFDADEPNLSVGLQASPTYIKPNQHELEALTGQSITTLDEAYHVGKDIVARYGTCPIITLGKDGTLAVLPDKAYFLPSLEINVVSASGAGDGMLAGIARAIHLGLPIEDGLRWGVALASAVCLQLGTADCRHEDVLRLLPQVRIEPYVV